MAILVDSRFRGPAHSGNGGYTCGVIAREHGGDELEVTLLQPPPLDGWLRLDGGRVWDDHALIAEVRDAKVELDPPGAVSWEEAVSAQAPDLHSPFPECFVCGHAREDGLHI